MNVNRRPLNTIRTKKSFNNDFKFTQITSQCDPNTEINSLSVKAIPFPLKSGDVLQVNGNDIILTADAAVDDTTLSITSFSPTKTIILNDKNKKQIFVPKGFAHGFLVLSEVAIVNYKVDNFYVDFFGRNTTCCVDSIFKVF